MYRAGSECLTSPHRAPTRQANIRVDWIHTPGSDLFLVLDTGYITDDTPSSIPGPAGPRSPS